MAKVGKSVGKLKKGLEQISLNWVFRMSYLFLRIKK